jgi:short-subunit dehydrogenase
MKQALVIGGANGIGLSIATELAKQEDCEKVYIVDKAILSKEYFHEKFESFQFDLLNADYSFFNRFSDVDTLMITAGFGKLSLFKDLDEQYIINTMAVNTTAVMRIIHCFYDKLQGAEDFFCGVMVSIAGFMSSPFFSVYGASKAALKIFIESVNVELEKQGSDNRILNVSPGSIKGTSFNNSKTDLSKTSWLAKEIIINLTNKNDLYIPQYDEIYKIVLERYQADFREEGRHSYEYKLKSGRINL